MVVSLVMQVEEGQYLVLMVELEWLVVYQGRCREVRAKELWVVASLHPVVVERRLVFVAAGILVVVETAEVEMEPKVVEVEKVVVVRAKVVAMMEVVLTVEVRMVVVLILAELKGMVELVAVAKVVEMVLVAVEMGLRAGRGVKEKVELEAALERVSVLG